MKVQVQKWGNSLALRIPKSFAVETDISNGSTVEITIENGQINLRPVQKEETLEELLEGITEENLHMEIDFGRAEGKELL
ncbi:MAG: AbrB/MazE/SpoVT family DNA-binding domain-containing protein [Aridibacter sp.]|jgi:antitoxin MazE